MLRRGVVFLVIACISASAALAAEPTATPAPMVMSGYRHSLAPAPDVPACARVEDEYFAQAILVGDSMADGLAIHGLVPELTLMTRIGLSARTAATEALFKHNGKNVTLAQKLPQMKPSAVYIWLGSNGLDRNDVDHVVRDYDRLLNRLLRALPGTPFYLLEVTPVQTLTHEKYAGFTNEAIDAFNEELHEIALRHNVYVLPVNALLKDEEGMLGVEYAGEDGIHLQAAAYEKLAEYLYTHVLPEAVQVSEASTEEKENGRHE